MLNDKELKTKILNSINDDDIPNFSSAIKQKHLEKSAPKKTPWYRKGWTWGIGIPALACGIVAAIIVPFMNNPSPIEKQSISIVGKKNEIAFGILSVSNMIDTSGSNIQNFRAKPIQKDEFEAQIAYLNPYMETAQQMLESNFDLNPTIIKGEYSLEGIETKYTNKMTIEANGESLQFYYNETNDNEIKLIDDEDDDDDDIDGEGEDAEEQEFQLNGVFDKNGVRSYVIGEKELENNEYELELNIYSNLADKNNYIRIKQEIETEANEVEQSYVYTKVSNGKTLFKAEIGFEVSDDDKPAVDVEIIADSNKSIYTIEKDNLNFKIEYKMLGNDGEIQVIVDEKNKTYTYKEPTLNYEITVHKNL